MRSKLLLLVIALVLGVAPMALAAGSARHSRSQKSSAEASSPHHTRAGKSRTHRSSARTRAKGLAKANPLAVAIPRTPAVITSRRDTGTACTLPDGSDVNWYHCYNAQQIRTAYDVNGITLADGSANQGQGQTIVLVDSYGSPTAASDLAHFAAAQGLPQPNFSEVYPNGNPQYNNACPPNNKGLSGPCGAAGWTGEATLDSEWADAIAPKAHIILLAVPPAETEGVQGLPNLFKAISSEIDATPAGTVFSMSFGITEQTLGGASGAQTSKFDAVFQKGLAKKDNFFASSGDNGSTGVSKQHKDSQTYSYPTVGWPASSPYVTAVGGTQLQDGWRWNPSSNDAFNSDGSFNPAYWQWTSGPVSQPVWNESWGPIGTGGGASAIYGRPSWQTAGLQYGAHRIVPDVAWNAAVNGGVDVYITAFPQYNCGNSTGCWTIYGGTSAASPQTAATVALANAARKAASKAPIGFLDPILYQQGLGASAYNDVTPLHYGSAPQTFAGSDVTVGTVNKSVGDLVDNQMWEVPIPGYPTTSGYDATTGWGTPRVNDFVAQLTTMP
jgi:subtilase family serine protease